MIPSLEPNTYMRPSHPRNQGQSRSILLRPQTKRYHSGAELTRDNALGHMRGQLRRMMSKQPPHELFWHAHMSLVPDIFAVDSPLNQEHITVAVDALPGMLDDFLSSEDRLLAYEQVGALLHHCYRRLYTKDLVRVTFIQSSDCLTMPTFLKTAFLLCSFFPCVSTIIALSLFMAAASEKEHQVHGTRADIVVTYLLFAGAIALDVSSITIFCLSHLRFYLPLPNNNCILQSACCGPKSSDNTT